MIFKRILDELRAIREAGEGRDRALLALGAQLTAIWEEQQEVKAAVESMDGAPFPLTDARMQEGIANLMSFDGRTGKGGG